MTRYQVKLTEQEELNLRQLALTPGFEVVLKLLRGESLNVQASAMECTGNMEARALAQMEAQIAERIVSGIIGKLAGYQQIPVPETEESQDPLSEIRNMQFGRPQ